MGRKTTFQEFVKRAKDRHGNKYEYFEETYIKASEKTKVLCKIHKEYFWVTPQNHYNSGCPICGGSKKLTTKEFIKKAEIVHGHQYNYNLVDYKNSGTKIKIVCSIHGIFEQTPDSHLHGSGCSFCSFEKLSKQFSFSQQNFLIRAKEVHGILYDYSLSQYKNNHTKIKILCKAHGVFEQTPNTHLSGSGCKLCVDRSNFQPFLQKDTTDIFITKANQTHQNFYDYSLVEYFDSTTKVKIICPIHGMFFQIPSNHTGGSGCPKCRSSKGERRIRKFLKNRIFQEQEPLQRNNKRPLYFDFYLPGHNLYIEYQGVQHYEPVMRFGGQKALEKDQKRDQFKRDWCKENKYKLLEIPYWDFDNIEKILKKELKL